MYSLMFLITAVAFAAFAGLCKVIYKNTPLSKGGRIATLIVVSLGVFAVLGVHGYVVFSLFKQAIINKSSVLAAGFLSALFLAPSIYLFERLLQKYKALIKRRDERGYKLDETTSYCSKDSQLVTTTWRVTIGDEADETALDGLTIAFLIAAAYNIGYIVVLYFLSGKVL